MSSSIEHIHSFQRHVRREHRPRISQFLQTRNGQDAHLYTVARDARGQLAAKGSAVDPAAGAAANDSQQVDITEAINIVSGDATQQCNRPDVRASPKVASVPLAVA
jgi:hypothetical protein